jgi:hypothetical protein
LFFLLPVLGACTERREYQIVLTNHTDANFLNGVARQSAAFFVMNSPRVAAVLKRAVAVTFSDGTRRRIKSVEPNSGGATLIVWLEGEPLDGSRVGFPSTVRIH